MAIQRVGIHKDKRLSGISKKIKEIKQYLENGNEDNAKIWAQTVINDENYVSAMEVVKLYLEQLLGRLDLMKDGPLPDMDQTIGTIIFATSYCDVKQMAKVRQFLLEMLKKQKGRDKQVLQKLKKQDEQYLNKLVKEKIRITKPQQGQVIRKLCDIKEKYNIPWEMSEQSKRILALYFDKTGGFGDLPPTPPPPTFPPSGGAGGDVPSSFTMMPMFQAQPAPVSQQQPHFIHPGAISQPSHPPIVAFPGSQQPAPPPSLPSQSLYPRPTVKQSDPMYPPAPIIPTGLSVQSNPSANAYPPIPPAQIPPPPGEMDNRNPSIMSDMDALQERLKNLKG